MVKICEKTFRLICHVKLIYLYLQSKEQNCHESRECSEEADTLVVDGVRGAVQGEEDDGAEAEDDRALAEEGAAVRPPVLVRARRLGEEHQQVDQEAGGGRGQVQEQHGRLHHQSILQFLVVNTNINTHLDVWRMVTFVFCEVIDNNDQVNGDYEDTITAGECLT